MPPKYSHPPDGHSVQDFRRDCDSSVVVMYIPRYYEYPRPLLRHPSRVVKHHSIRPTKSPRGSVGVHQLQVLHFVTSLRTTYQPRVERINSRRTTRVSFFTHWRAPVGKFKVLYGRGQSHARFRRSARWLHSRPMVKPILGKLASYAMFFSVL